MCVYMYISTYICISLFQKSAESTNISVETSNPSSRWYELGESVDNVEGIIYRPIFVFIGWEIGRYDVVEKSKTQLFI